MPRKKSSKKPGKGAGKKGKKTLSAMAKPQPEDKEVLLQNELDNVTEQLDKVRVECDKLRQDNVWLEEEIQRVRLESHEYMAFVEKKTTKRQEKVISLSDYNRQQIKKIKEQHETMMADYKLKIDAVKDTLIQKEAELAQVKEAYENLEEFRQLQTEQTTKIRELEKEIQKVRRNHTQKLQELKENFLSEKQQCQSEADTIVKDTVRRANKEACERLTDYTIHIKQENASQRRRLLHLIKQTRVLENQKVILQNQHKELLREQQFAKDLRKIRTERNMKLMEKRFKDFGLNREDMYSVTEDKSLRSEMKTAASMSEREMSTPGILLSRTATDSVAVGGKASVDTMT